MKQVKVFMTLTLKKIWSDCFMDLFKNLLVRRSSSDSDSNKNSNQMNRQNVVKIPIYDLIYNTTRFNHEFLENTRVNRYCIFVFLKLNDTKEYIYSESKQFIFNPGENNVVEIALGNEKIKGLKLFIKQKGNEDNYIGEIMLGGNKRLIQMSFFESSSFVCLDGKFEEDKLKKLVYFNKKKNNEECCVANFDFPLNFSEESWNKLVDNVKFAQGKDNKQMTIGGKVVPVSFVNGVLLGARDFISFDLFCIAHNLQKSGINVIQNHEDKAVMSFCFIKAKYFGDTNWHFDDKLDMSFDSPTLKYEPVVDGNMISIYAFKMFVRSGSLENFLSNEEDSCFTEMNDNAKIEFLRNNGFIELELYTLSYSDPNTGRKISKKVFLTLNFMDLQNIDKSIIYTLSEAGIIKFGVGAHYRGEYYDCDIRMKVWRELVANVKFAQEQGNKKMIIRGKVVSASFVGGVLLNEESLASFDPFYIALNLQESGINVIRNGKDEKIMVFSFIKSDYFRDIDWHFDDMSCHGFENNAIAYYQAMFRDGNQKHYIDFYGWKIFICSGSKEYEISNKTDSDFRKWDSKQQMKFLKDKGFAELELHKIRYTDPENGQEISKLVLLPVNSLEQEIIKESLIYQLENPNKDELHYKGQRYSPKERKEKWKKLSSETLIIGTKPKIVNTVVLKINKESFLNFLSRNLENKFSSYGLTDYYFTVRINGEENFDKAEIFRTVCNNKDDRSKEIILEHNDNIHQFSLQVDNCSEELECLCSNDHKQKASSIILVLQKDMYNKLALFCGGEKTNIEITSNEQTEITVKKNKYGQLELWLGDKKLDAKVNSEILHMPKTENQNNIDKYQSFHK